MKYLINLCLLMLMFSIKSFSQPPGTQWQKAMGGAGDDQSFSVIQTSDGGYISVGHTNGTGGDVTSTLHGGYDIWVVKLSSSGAIQWQKNYGGSSDDYGILIQQTSDGYIVGGFSFSNDGDISGHHDGFSLNNDFILLKIDNSGNLQWEKTYGGSGLERANGLLVVPGGYVFTCSSSSTDGDVTGNHGGNDYWVVKVNNTGVIQWQKSYGGSADDFPTSIASTNDGGFIVNGYSASNNGNVSGNHGGYDYWVVKLNGNGTLQWQKSIGGSSADYGEAVIQNTDSTYVVSGASNSNNGNVSGAHGDYDYWTAKLTKDGNVVWQKSLGGSGSDWCNSIKPTFDGGYILGGQSNSVNGNVSGNHGGYDYWVAKLNGSGVLQWQKSLGGSQNETMYSIQPTSDFGYILGGLSASGDGDVTGAHGSNDYWIVKLNADPQIAPKVTITSVPGSPICAGTPVTFTAKLVNGGVSPVYQWKKNNIVAGTNNAIYTDSALNNGDVVFCTVKTGVGNVNSNKLTYVVNPILTPAATIISSPAGPVCQGTKVQFTASVANGGSTPVYKWMKNGVTIGTNSLTYSDLSPASRDSITFQLTSNAACLTIQSVTSNHIIEKVDVPSPVIKIASNKDTTICSSTKVTFTATVTPSYLWKKNGIEVGSSGNKYVDSTLKTNDNVQCLLVSSATACNGTVANIINSNILEFTVKGPPAKPSSITAPSNVTAHQIVYFSVTNVAGITYAWTLPSGALIDSGQGSSKIKVTWGTVGGTVSVIAINGCGSSAPRQMQVVVKASLTAQNNEGAVKQSIAPDNDIHLTPNPASTFATLTFAAKTQDKYVITITDAQNKVVQVKNVVSIKGQNQLKLNTTGLAKGVYYVTVNNSNATKSKKLIVGQ